MIIWEIWDSTKYLTEVIFSRLIASIQKLQSVTISRQLFTNLRFAVREEAVIDLDSASVTSLLKTL